MKRLLTFLKDYRREAVLAPALKMLEAFFDLFVPLVTADIINRGIGNGDTGYIMSHVMILILLGLLGLAASITAQYFAAKAAVGVSTAMRHTLFDHIQSFGFSDLDKAGTGTLITRMTSDINQVQNGVNLFLRLFLRSPFIVFGAMIRAFTISVKAALIFVVAIPVLAVIVF
ncbi:MAG: ABC transporter transmembrane domain-containing protein, partial [Lachnospiraceae bacterium]|nr:ABC transporter transmembrane domain-containing protein [Lachnospiraceae bacterium]